MMDDVRVRMSKSMSIDFEDFIKDCRTVMFMKEMDLYRLIFYSKVI